MGQLDRDIQILNLNYGIAFGIDTTTNKVVQERHNKCVRGNNDNIAFIIL
jgi:hypothetical protein